MGVEVIPKLALTNSRIRETQIKQPPPIIHITIFSIFALFIGKNMLTRVVKLTINPANATDFVQIFEESKSKILAFEGCHHLKLFSDKKYPNIFFTYSVWENETALNNYRHSDLFKDTWSRTKKLFACRPEAWSLDQHFEGDS